MTNQQHVETGWSIPKSLQVMAHDRSDRIYTDFFNLKGSPFSITPDPEFLFLSETHRSVLEKIQYGIQSRMGFMLLTGEVGTGKTTLCRALLDHLQDRIQTVYVINPSLNGLELLAGILDDLGVSYPERASKKALIDRLNRYLLENEEKSPVVIIVDDAQTMPLETLEDLRLLSNLETDKTKLLQMLLVGQPELLTQLDQPDMRQLKQRVAVNCHLDYLGLDEVGGYIERRLFIAGNQGQIRFASKVIRQIHKQSGGVPRMINKICDMALIAAYAANSYVVQSSHLKAASSELIELQGIDAASSRSSLSFFQRMGKPLGTAAALLSAMVFGFLVKGFWGQQVHPVTQTEHANRTITEPLFQHTEAATEKDPAPTDKSETALPSLQSTPYILQLGSFNTLGTTLRAVDIYTRKGITAHWNEVQLGEKGLWYRVFAGRFESMDAARHYQKTSGLEEARILFAPWTVLIDSAGSTEQIAHVRKRIQSRGVDAYSASGHDDRRHLCAGAFVSQNRAEALAQKIHRNTGIATQVANFHPALMSGKPSVESETGGDAS
ncbi:MAG: AAA family ATPase [Desulfobacteraceae bacterium]|jgi:general secretion pathway protein A